MLVRKWRNWNFLPGRWECGTEPFWKTVWQFLKKLNIDLPLDPATPARRLPRRDENICKNTHTHFHSVIQKSQKVGTNHMSINRGTDKPNVEIHTMEYYSKYYVYIIYI